MTDAFNPPKTLSEDDVRRVADVRRDVWTAGIKGAAFTEADAARAVMQLCLALAHCHNRGVVHRDVKPGTADSGEMHVALSFSPFPQRCACPLSLSAMAAGR